jgi:hypothetical protein
VEQYLRYYDHDILDDWVKWHPLAEFAANNHTSEITNCSTFSSNYGIHLQMTFGQHPITDPYNIHKVNTQQMAQPISQLFSELCAEMKRAQAIQSAQAYNSRRVSTSLGVGDKAWLDEGNLLTT